MTKKKSEASDTIMLNDLVLLHFSRHLNLSWFNSGVMF